MKHLIDKILPKDFNERRRLNRLMREWGKRDFLENAPQLVKQKIFAKYGIPDAIWVETGTYKGLTTQFLAENYQHVYSIEPSDILYNQAVEKFRGQNVTLYNDVSENVLPDLLPTLEGDINFWLDGHYSAGVTFKGDKDCPIEDELMAIKTNASNFSAIRILVDDVRYFLPNDDTFDDYPSIDYLVDWARTHKFIWRIEHDIFIMQRG